LADKILLEVVTPVERVLSKEVDEVVAPGELGEFGVLPGHVPFLTLLLPGELRYRIGGDERRFIVTGGVADVRDDRVTILADDVEDLEDVNVEAARAEAEALLEKLRDFGGSRKELKELNRRLRLAQVRAGMG